MRFVYMRSSKHNAEIAMGVPFANMETESIFVEIARELVSVSMESGKLNAMIVTVPPCAIMESRNYHVETVIFRNILTNGALIVRLFQFANPGSNLIVFDVFVFSIRMRKFLTNIN